MSVAATAVPPRRAMECGRCGAEWSVPVLPLPDKKPVYCPYCEAHICGCGCGADLRSKRTDAIYEAESHWKRLKRATSTAIAPPSRTVADARALQEDAKAHWSMVVDEAILRRFKADPSGVFHADDLESLGIPDEHRNVIGSQIAKWVNRRRMVECGRRASVVPSRNGAKSNEYRLTKTGRDLVSAGLNAENPEGNAGGVEPARPAPSTGLGSLTGGIPRGAGSALSVQSGENDGAMAVENPPDVASPDPSPRSSTEEHRTPKAGRPGSNPGGGIGSAGVLERSSREARGVRDNPGTGAASAGDTLKCVIGSSGEGGDANGRNRLDRGGEDRAHVTGADSGKSGVGPDDLHHGHLPATSPYSTENEFA